MPERLSSDPISTRLQRIAELARQAPEMVFTTLAHHIDTEFLREACRRTRKDGAVGVDGQTARDFAGNLEENLQSLLDRFKSGRYRAPPVRRVFIPKGDGQSQRPIGIPTFEDKALQRAVVMVLEAVYEQDFLDCSFGFRPGRSAHQAVQALWTGLMRLGGGWVLELDIRSFFDEMDKGHLRSFLDQRVRDGVIRRTIDKWLAAGVLEEGRLRHPKTGTPQGGVVSPILSNVYLHEVLDRWFEEVVKPRLEGEAFLIRYADDATLVFSLESDAQRVLDVLPKRFAKYGLTLHPTKTRLIDFRRPTGPSGGGGKSHSCPSTFVLLGFTHYWGRSRRGTWVVKRKTAKQSFSRAVRSVAQWCRRFRHEKIRWQHRALVRKLSGHYGYFGITGNGTALGCFLYVVTRTWRKWLSRRSQRGYIPWDRFHQILRRYPLPAVRVVHSVYRRVAKPCT